MSQQILCVWETINNACHIPGICPYIFTYMYTPYLKHRSVVFLALMMNIRIKTTALMYNLLFFLPGGKSGSAGSRRPVKTVISVNDRVSVFLELAEAHRLLGNQV